MDAQIQCPVCTLYLHPGMNLQDHLESHPKEKVIAALVNLTLFQQQTHDDCKDYYYCNQYDTPNHLSETQMASDLPLVKTTTPTSLSTRTHQQNNNAISAFGGSIQYNSTEPAAHEVMIVDRTRVFHERSNVAMNDNSCRRRILTNSDPSIITTQAKNRTIPAQALQLITTNSLATNQAIQTLRPPPPYCLSVKDNLLKQSLSFPEQNVLNPNANENINVELQRQKNQDGSCPPYEVLALAPDHQSENMIAMAAFEPKTSQTSQPDENKKKDNRNIHHSVDNIDTKISVEYEQGYDPDDNEKEQQANASANSSPISDKHQDTTPQGICSFVVAKNSTNDITESNIKVEKSVEKRTAGLQVISNVKVTPNTVLNISSLNSHIGDTVSMKDIFIIGAASSSASSSRKLVSKASTSRASSQKHLFTSSNINNSEIYAKTGSTNLMDASNIQVDGSEKTIYIDSVNDEEQSNKVKSHVPSTDDTSMACSSKATSVIRMASQASIVDVKPTQRTATTTAKLAYNRPPKKLVVKLKKPFVPVIGEEANLHPPENRTDAMGTPFNSSAINVGSITLKNDINDDENSDNLNLMLKCSEDVPYSPIRQSYTPQLPFNQYQDCDELNVMASDEIFESKYVPGCSYKMNSETSFDNAADLECNQSCLDDKNGVIVFEISIEDSKDLQNVENVPEWKPHKGNKLHMENHLGNDIMPCTSSCGAASSSLHHLQQSDCSNGISYRLPTFHQNDDDYTCTGINQLSQMEGDACTSNPHFGSKYKYTSLDLDKRSSYMNIDRCKNATNAERAPSTDSLNIITDEKMPAKGEISEQESNGDIESSWGHHQLFLDNENLPRYTSSYDTTVARESWSLSNEQLPHELENMSTILSNFTIIEQSEAKIDIKPSTEHLVHGPESSKGKLFARARKYRCPVCSLIFASLKEKRIHLINAHDYQESFSMVKDPSKSSKNPKAQRPIATITSGGSSSALISYDAPLIQCKMEKTETTQIAKPFASLNNYLLNYNWNTLKARSPEDRNLQKLFAIIDSGTNYVCKICEEKFNSIRAYDIHMVIHPAECYTCGRTFKRWVNFSIHLKRHLNIREHCCSHCPKRFVLRQNMIEHMRIHSNEAPLKCGICMKRFKRYSNLIQHRNRHHLKLRPKDKDYICSCGEVFHSQAKIAWHRETHDAKPKCCPYCRERFMHKNSLVRHIRLSHTERFHLFKRDSVECPYCKKKYIKSSLKVHMEQHKASKTTYECTICNKSLTTKWNLKQHKWIHASRSSKPFKCSMCTKAFVRETEFISHMNTHKSIKPYTCDHCGCQFARKYNWLRHTREHTTPKNFRCDTCYKVFHRAYYLKEHKRSHTGERPFECAICGKTSTTKTNHNKHVKIHHARDPLTAEV